MLGDRSGLCLLILWLGCAAAADGDGDGEKLPSVLMTLGNLKI